MESINSIVKVSRIILAGGLVIALLTCTITRSQAQTFAEWFSQKKTQKKYLLQQIAALQVYSGYLRQGYSIATGGLGSISGYLKSENALHGIFYNRLRIVDPVVKNNPMVKEILAWQQDILTRTRETNQYSGITTEEKNYLTSVWNTVLRDCDQQLNTLQNVVGDAKLEMSDAERIAAISKIHAAMLANYRFASDFAAKLKMLAVLRQREENQMTVSKRINGIN
jgi:hypothetical protein